MSSSHNMRKYLKTRLEPLKPALTRRKCHPSPHGKVLSLRFKVQSCALCHPQSSIRAFRKAVPFCQYSNTPILHFLAESRLGQAESSLVKKPKNQTNMPTINYLRRFPSK